ncbi:MAG: sarcosine oxidase subunit gamma family protein [Dongiaceae bacterium]
MVEAYQRRSALNHFGLAARASQGGHATAGVILGEAAHRTILNIRGDSNDPAFTGAVKSVTGVDLPSTANTVNRAGDSSLLWLGPNEWWLVTSPDRADELVPALRQAFQGQHTAVIDVSESRTAITLTGPKARDLLARGISLDLHPRVFGPGQCAQTSLSKCNVVLHQVDEKPGYDIYVLKSFSDYLWQWLEKVAGDFGLAISA